MNIMEIEELEGLQSPDGLDVALGVGIGVGVGAIIWGVAEALATAAVLT
jgi:hypothetical protein